MPLYKWCVIPGNVSDFKILSRADVDAVANLRMVNIIRQLSQLVSIADDVFRSVGDDCRMVFQRTQKLSARIERCQIKVDNFNAKKVPVPVGTLTDHSPTTVHYTSCHERHSDILGTETRPPSVQQLRQRAEGPSPPVCMQGNKVASSSTTTPEEADGRHATHIYCQPLRPESIYSSKSIKDPGRLSSTEKMNSVKVPSTIVPIDTSGQTFSRMSSFRRSLIHMDFLIRRKKKKDKRRNTVSEGETKELKEVLNRIAIVQNQLPTVPKNPEAYQQNGTLDVPTEEKNNNIISDTELKVADSNHINISDTNGVIVLPQDVAKKKLEFKNQRNVENNKMLVNNRRKPRSHIPISTISAAMTVAVEMRQCNGKSEDGDESSIGNCSQNGEQTSSDSERKIEGIKVGDRSSSSSLSQSEDSLQIDKEKSRREYLIERMNKISLECTGRRGSTKSETSDNTEVSSCTSSENCHKTRENDTSSSALSAGETEAFFISDESDDDSSNFFQNNYGSSTSLSTISDGSLNSLLSRTGTEMTSSTGTLTSVGQEQVSISPPPPPPPMIYAVAPKEIEAKISSNEKQNAIKKSPKKSVKSPQKTSKANSVDKKHSPKHTKSLFNSLVNKKSQGKPEPKVKSPVRTPTTPPAFDMYGSRSPRKVKKEPIFLKENTPPVVETVPKSQLQSFCPNKSRQSESESDEYQQTYVKELCTSPVTNSSETSLSTVTSDTAVPLKYTHQVTVRPISRNSISEMPSSALAKSKTNAVIPNYNSNALPTVVKPQRPTSLVPDRSKSSARVVLDPEGRIIYCTNSLDRRPGYLSNHNHNHEYTCHCHYQQRPLNCGHHNSLVNNHHQCHVVQNTAPCYNHNPIIAEFYPRHGVLPTRENHVKVVCPSDDESQSEYNMRPIEVPDPNVSGLPPAETMLTKYNVSLHSQKLGNRNLNHTPTSSSECSYVLSPPSQKTSSEGSSLDEDMHKLKNGSMSTDDLFAVIHNCKKRLNIKTDSELSLASSSRSSSPSYSRPSSARSGLAETGFLSPRNSYAHCDKSRDRRSWSDFRSPPYNERKSLASDRLGPMKPTSMHDFKMLLLQTRSNNNNCGPRKSAVEMLKVPLNQSNQAIKSPQSLSPRNCSPTNHMSPSSDMYLYNGHSTVPFKRGNRVRTSLQPRYTMYPPIFEDCSEEAENLTAKSTSNIGDRDDSRQCINNLGMKTWV